MFDAKSALPTDRGSALCAAIGNRAYIIGGINRNSSYLVSNECYDLNTNTFTLKQSIISDRKSGAGITSIGSKIYVVGGYSGNRQATNYCYDSVSDTWSSKSAMSVTRDSLSAVSKDGLMYALGGAETSSVVSNKNECYNSSTDTWSLKEPIPTTFNYAKATIVGDDIYLAGNSASTFYCYNIPTNKWTTKASIYNALSLALFSDGKYVYGYNVGFVSSSDPTIYKYDPANDSWVGIGDKLAKLSDEAIVLMNNLLFIFGGKDGSYYSNSVKFVVL